MRVFSKPLIAVALITAAVACSGDSLNPRVVAGTYSLVSISGNPDVFGSLTLGRDGRAERRVRYSNGLTYVAIGTFSLLRDGVIDLRLREDNGKSSYEWRPHTTVDFNIVTIQSPNPADGPDVVEIYQR